MNFKRVWTLWCLLLCQNVLYNPVARVVNVPTIFARANIFFFFNVWYIREWERVMERKWTRIIIFLMRFRDVWFLHVCIIRLGLSMHSVDQMEKQRVLGLNVFHSICRFSITLFVKNVIIQKFTSLWFQP